MPGNEVGDRVHNFFGQENLSQGQHHSQPIDGNWPGLSNNLWAGGQRQIAGPFVSGLKNYNIQQPEPERGHGSQSSHMPHGSPNFTQSNLKSDFGRVQSPNQQLALNGYVHGNQVFQSRQNEASFLGVDTDTNRHNLMARGLSMSQQGNAHEHNKKNSMRLDASESPVSFDFFGSQQQMSGQHLNMMQPLPRQQPGNNDIQLLQRHMMLQQLQEFQRHQQLQQLEARQQSFTNQVSSAVKQGGVGHPPSLINGVPINEPSNNLWQPELVAGSTSWLQRGASPVMQGSSSGHMFSPEQGQALRLMDMVPQQADQSLYGVPISSTSGTPGSYSHIQMDKAPMQQISANNDTVSGNPYATFPDQVNMQEGTRQDFHGKNMFGSATGQGLGTGFNLETLQRVNNQNRSPPMQEFQGRQEVAESSEPSQEKSFDQVASSQNAATLDPTEEKILFGSDENIWEAFGGSTKVGMGGYNMLDGAEFSSGFSSLQSGSWSALMQSAVAESTSGDTGIQEEWCGPSAQNSDVPPANQQLSNVNHGGKLQGVWGDNNFQPATAPSSRPSSIPVDTSRPNSSVNSFGLPQFQQSEYKSQQVQGEMLQDSSQRFIPKFSEQGSKWSDRGNPQKQPIEGSQIYGSVSHPSGAETNANSNSGSWARQQSTSSHNSDTNPYNRTNGWNFIDSVPADGGESFRTPEKQNTLQPAQSGDGRRAMHDELGHVAGMWRTDSTPTSNAELEPKKPSVGSPRVGMNASSLNNMAVANSSNMRQNQEGKQQLPNSQKLDFWKVIDPSVNSKGAEGVGKNQHNLGKSPQILESSGNHSFDRGMVDGHEVDNSNNKDNSTDSFHSLHHSSPASSKDNVWSDATDSRPFPGGKQKSSGNIGRRLPGTRKFQYHPMGDVDVDNEPSYGAKPVTHSETIPQQVLRGSKGYDQGSIGPSKFVGHMDKSSFEAEKGHGPGGQVGTKGLDATPPKSMFPGFAPNTSSFGRGISNYVPNKVPPSSQNMLELLHKVDHPREHGTPTHLSSSDRNMSSDMPEPESSDGSVGHVQRNQPSSSQNFGLQLAPPSQRHTSSDHVVSSQNSSKPVFGSPHITHEAEKGPMHLASRTSGVPFPSSYEPSSQGHGNSKASYPNAQGSYSAAFPSGFPYAKSLENQRMHASSGQIMGNQSVHMPFNRISTGSRQLDDSSERAQASQFNPSPMPDMAASTPHNNNLSSSAEASRLSSADQTQKKDLVQHMLESDRGRATPPSIQEGTFPKMLPNAWSSVSQEHPSLSAQTSKAASSLSKSQLQSNDNLIATFPGPPKHNEQDNVEGRNEMSGTEVISADSQSFVAKEHSDKIDGAKRTLSGSQGNDSVVNSFSEASLASHAATQRDIEAFGRSLRPNNSLHDNYSLLHQVQAMKSPEIDSTDRSTKRLKGSDHVMDSQLVDAGGSSPLTYGYNVAVRDSLPNQSTAPSGDLKMPSFSSKLGDTRDSNASSQDMFASAQNISNNFPSTSNTPSVRGEHPKISPRMAPSWFDQYGTFKNGQMLQVHEMQRTAKSVEQPLTVGKLADDEQARDSMEQGNIAADGGKFGNAPQASAPTSAVSEHFTSTHLIPHAGDQSLVVERPKKRKSATSELVPWHKELMNVSQRLQTISVAEVEWAKATNRLAEKVEEYEMVEEVPPVIRPRRRLILTTQLMQQLLRPPPPAVLSSDALSQSESAVYFSARLALGDACSAAGCSESEAPLPGDDKNLSSEKLKTPKRIDRGFSNVVEDFVGRVRKLESDLLRLDKRASILDLRVECQDLEKFSVINRFAKFHGRGQTDGVETSSASDGALNGQKSFPQKYVTGLPMPRNLPDRVQCLSL